jgi:pimeloyl-ACP methyl ester carboxylesterase
MNAKINFLVSLLIFNFHIFGSAAVATDVMMNPANNYFEGFIRVSSKTELYIQWHKAATGKPTVFLINGLTYSTRQWDQFAQALRPYGIGVIQFDMQGMGRTLLKYAPIKTELSYQTQVQNLKSLITQLKIRSKVNLVGLSYGGGIALAFAQTYPQMVQNIFVMAPFTAPLALQDSWIKLQVATTRFLYPYNPYTDDEIYDYFLKQYVYSTFPAADPLVTENPYKLEATFRLAQGIRSYKADREVNKFPANSVHLIIAGRDEVVDRETLESFWSIVPPAAQASKIVILQSKHKIPEIYPTYSAAWIAGLLLHRSRLSSEKVFEGNPATGVVRSDSGLEFILEEP